MKRPLLSFALAMSFVFAAGFVHAENSVQQPPSVIPSGVELGSYYGEEETAVADDAVPEYGVAGAPSCGSEPCCESCGDDCSGDCCDSGSCTRLRDLLPDGNDCFGWRLPCSSGEAETLFNPSDEKWSLGGWVNGGVRVNNHGAKNNGPVAFPSTDELMLNQLWFFAERKADNGGSGWAWGVRVDYIFGADGPDTQAFGDGGWDFGWNSGGKNNFNHTYGSAIPQLYAEVAYNDVTIKVGRFFTIIGYEVVQAPDNFFYSHAYTHNYGEPFTHTGALAEWSVDEETTIYGGYVTGWDSGWENRNDSHMALGGLSLNWWEDATITYAFTAGDNGFTVIDQAATDNGDLYMHSLILDYKLTDKWTYIFESDLGIQANQSSGLRDNQWYGINQYLLYTINDCWASGLRVEWFNDEDGARVGGTFADRGDYIAVTAGLNYKPNPNLIIRPEIRYDWFEPDVATASAFGNGDTEQLSAAIDAIFTY